MWYLFAGVFPPLLALGLALAHGVLARHGSEMHARSALVWTVIAVAYGSSWLILALLGCI